MNVVHDYRVRENQRRGKFQNVRLSDPSSPLLFGFVLATYILLFPLFVLSLSLSLRFSVSCSQFLLLFWFIDMFNR